MSDNTFYAVVAVCVAAVLISLMATLALYNYGVDRLRITNGYQQETIPGCGYPVWRKAGK